MISVEVGIGPHSVDVEAYDDGRGFTLDTERGAALTGQAHGDGNPAGHCGGTGLAVMQERAEQLGGQFFLFSVPGKGTRMRLWVPLPRRRYVPQQTPNT
jgi:signal transduction histidine kinase